MDIRPAAVDDALAIATVHVRSWQGAYRGLIPDSYLDALAPEDRLAMWADFLAATSMPRQGTLVLVDEDGPQDDRARAQGGIVGFASFGPTRDDDADPTAVGELQTLYLDPGAWGRGGATELLRAVVSELRAAGFADATLWVLGANAHARRFYERRGWHADGATKLHDWQAFVATDVRYRMSLV